MYQKSWKVEYKLQDVCGYILFVCLACLSFMFYFLMQVLVEGLGRCREDVQARVTAYLQREPQAAPLQLSWSVLLHTQADNKHTTTTTAAAKHFKPINDPVMQNENHPSQTISQGSSQEDVAGKPRDELTKLREVSGHKLAKRRRENEDSDDFGSLLDSLKHCQGVMKRMKEEICTQRGGDAANDTDKWKWDEVKSVLEEMLSLLDTETL